MTIHLTERWWWRWGWEWEWQNILETTWQLISRQSCRQWGFLHFWSWTRSRWMLMWLLHNLLWNRLLWDIKLSESRWSNYSSTITLSSRIGAALIMLRGKGSDGMGGQGRGRWLKAMRTHGMAKPTVYANFHRVIHAINTHPALEILCDNSPTELKKRSDEFKERSSFDLFQYCTGAIDGQAIYIIDRFCQVLK